MPASPSSETDSAFEKSTYGLALEIPGVPANMKRNTSTVSLPSPMGSKSGSGRETLRKRASSGRIAKRHSSTGTSRLPDSENSTPERDSRASTESDDVPNDILLEYLEYRRKNKQESGGKAEKCWPDDVEDAFMAALALTPKLGRKKKHVGGKLCGRNELISKFIFDETGKHRTRKQISSHIQVLKGKLKFCPKFMDRVSNVPRPGEERANHTLPSSTTSAAAMFADHLSPALLNGLRLGANRPVPNLAPIDLAVWIGPEDRSSAGPNHTITKLDSFGQQPELALSSLKDLDTRFPCVPHHLRHGNLNMHTPIIHVDCSISRPPPSLSQEGLFMHSTFQVVTRGIAPGVDLKCTTTVLAHGKALFHEELPLVVSEDAQGMQYIPVIFPGNLWLDFLRLGGDVIDPSLGPATSGSPSVDDFTITQEFIAIDPSVGSQPCLFGLYLWELSEERTEVEGSVRWTRVSPSEPHHHPMTHTVASSSTWNMMPNTSHPQTVSPSELVYQHQAGHQYNGDYLQAKQEPVDHYNVMLFADRAPPGFFSSALDVHGYHTMMAGGHESMGQHWHKDFVEAGQMDIC